MSTSKLPFLACAAAIAFGTIGAAQAGVVLNFPTFAGTCNTPVLTCVGNTAEAGGALRVTPADFFQAGAGYSTAAIALGANATFSTSFQFLITSAGGIAPADGLTFVIAAGTGGLGAAGSGIGYAGVGNSVAVEFDTFNNGGGDGNSSNHVGIDVNGSPNSVVLANPYGVVTCDFASGYVKPGCMSNGDIWTIVINYDGAKLDVSVQDGNGAPQLLISDFVIDIAAALGTTTAFVGFTSGTGSGFANHDILNWILANDASITPPGQSVPEPATLSLVPLALLLAVATAARARRRARGSA